MEKLKYKSIAIDFDGTIAKDGFPKIGSLFPHADRVIRKIKEHGGQIIIWTCRTGEYALYAEQYLWEHEIPYDTFNEELPDIANYYGGSGRKVYADIYIDDRSIHCQNIDWLEIENMIFEEVHN